LPWSTDRRVVLRGELGGEPGERSAEDVAPLDHHQLLSVSLRVFAALPRM
jgi:hypothetical protein